MFTSDSRRYFALFFQKLDVWELFSKFPYDMRGNRALGFSDKDGSSPIFSAYSREIQRLAGFFDYAQYITSLFAIEWNVAFVI